jgi:hypothetical protein
VTKRPKWFSNIRGPYQFSSGLPTKDDVAHAKSMDDFFLDTRRRALFDHLYDCLSVIDSKTGSLFTANSVLAAVFALLLDGEAPTAPGRFCLLLGLVALLVSTLILIATVRIHWTTTKQFSDAAESAGSAQHHKKLQFAGWLLRLRDRRTKIYRTALIATFLAIVVLFLYVMGLFLSVLPAVWAEMCSVFSR